MAPTDNWLNRQVQAGVAGVGSFAGSIVNGVGNSVTGAGRSLGDAVANTTRSWGDSVRMTGNSVKDATRATGPRAATAQNPLGLARNPQAVTFSRGSGSGGGTVQRGTARDPLGLNK